MLLSTAFSTRFHNPHCASLDGDGDSLLKIIRMPVADASPTTPSVLEQRMPGSSWPRSLHARLSVWLERLQGIGNDRLETTLKRARHMFAAQLSDHGLCLGLHNAAMSRCPEPADKPIAASQKAISGLIHTRLLKLGFSVLPLFHSAILVTHNISPVTRSRLSDRDTSKLGQDRNIDAFSFDTQKAWKEVCCSPHPLYRSSSTR